MARDASLTDFTGDTTADDGDDGGTPEDPATKEATDDSGDVAQEVGAATDATDERADHDSPSDSPALDADQSRPEPVVSTSRLVETPASCPDCGTAVERTWRDGSVLVCPDCKEW